jgi:hypothetical protein
MAAPQKDQSSDDSKARAKADPTLKRLLQDADDEQEIGVSLALKADAGSNAAVQKALKRAEDVAGSAPSAVNLLKNIPYLIVKAKPSFIDALLHESVVESGIANDQPEDVVIRPVKKGSDG